MDVMTASGLTNFQGVNKLGGNSDRIFEVAREYPAFHSFIELHIEQGAVLEEANLDIGIVQGIVGLRWWDVEITGFTRCWIWRQISSSNWTLHRIGCA